MGCYYENRDSGARTPPGLCLLSTSRSTRPAGEAVRAVSPRERACRLSRRKPRIGVRHPLSWARRGPSHDIIEEIRIDMRSNRVISKILDESCVESARQPRCRPWEPSRDPKKKANTMIISKSLRMRSHDLPGKHVEAGMKQNSRPENTFRPPTEIHAAEAGSHKNPVHSRALAVATPARGCADVRGWRPASCHRSRWERAERPDHSDRRHGGFGV